MFCSKCGTEASTDSQFCSKWGQPLAEAAAPVGPDPVVINGVTYTPGSGPFAGLYVFPGGGWVTIENGQIRKASALGGGPSGGRIIAAIICFIVGGFALLQSFSWFAGFAELDADGNMFAGMPVPLALGALSIGAAFVIGGIVLLSRKR
ncbi:MAG: zinc ribbon domain-containing protein [Actinobacteria bacterium]|nr:zinc ribbon domain-containing protein [Actinomycetota bacterium]